MGLRSNDRPDESPDDHHRGQPATLDPETVRRIEHALEGTVEIDVSKLSADDKLTLLIERYNRKLRDDGRQNS